MYEIELNGLSVIYSFRRNNTLSNKTCCTWMGLHLHFTSIDSPKVQTRKLQNRWSNFHTFPTPSIFSWSSRFTFQILILPIERHLRSAARLPSPSPTETSLSFNDIEHSLVTSQKETGMERGRAGDNAEGIPNGTEARWKKGTAE